MTKQNESGQFIDCIIPVWNGKYFKEDFWLPEKQVYTLTITYPFNKPAEFEIKTGKKGMGLAGLMRQIHRCYVKKFKAARKDPNDGYWHALGDLVVEGILLDHDKKTIRLHVGS